MSKFSVTINRFENSSFGRNLGSMEVIVEAKNQFDAIAFAEEFAECHTKDVFAIVENWKKMEEEAGIVFFVNETIDPQAEREKEIAGQEEEAELKFWEDRTRNG